uniref:Activator of Hsp90 ATPase AHSA1-like N-terminal domain-containing protein n=1 Tax=Noctiluca scintillans TaxID=2966 RepID=A7WQ61_NOCSC|nr:conserved hypothetical protein [Noctiluca scintillans]
MAAADGNVEEVKVIGAPKPKNTGYTYWKRDAADAHILPDHTPKRVESDGVQIVSEEGAARLPEKTLVSKWNSAGTWEQKNVSSTATPLLQQILCEEAFVLLEGEGHRIAATSATVTGESDVFYVNSKLRLGFELAVKLKWSGTFDGEEVSGDLEVPDLDSSMDSFDVKAKAKAPATAAGKKAADALKSGAKPAIRRAKDELVRRMLEDV